MAKIISLRLLIFTLAAVPVLSFKTNESYPETNKELDVSLSFDNTELTHLTDGFVKGEFLTHLSLEGNRIESISESAFGFVPRLTHLSLADNFLENIDLQQFSSIKSLKTLNLNKNCKKQNQAVIKKQVTSNQFGLWNFENYDSTPNYEQTESPPVTRIPCIAYLSAKLPNLSKLYLEDNNLMELIFSNEMNLPLLTHLYLSHNNIRIGKDTLLNLNQLAPSLSDLHLKNSGINQFDASQLTTVTSLYLDLNNIWYICNENCEFDVPYFLKLKGAQNLETVSLSMNQLSKIKADSFNSTTRLVTLDLSWNQISEILEGTFDKLHVLQFLSLEHNHIVQLSAVHTFKSLINLENLYLGYNQILNISEGTFETMVALKTLELNGNKISIIKSGTFSNLASLEKLSLADNQLSNIPDGCMPTSGSLITLNLDNNNFTSTKYISLTNLPNLMFLSLKNNPLTAINLHWHSIVSENLTIILDNVCQYY